MVLRNSEHKLIEPMIYEGTADSNTVMSYFNHTLKKLKPTNMQKVSVVILDNASYHKSQELKDLFELHNCILIFLPPYSPDLNPIENLWGTIKQELRNYYDYTISLLDNQSNVVSNHTL